MKILPSIVIALFLCASVSADFTPQNSQAEGEEPPSPQEALEALTLPKGFKATLFAAEPDVRQPIAIDIDPKGRLWVAESYSYYDWKKRGEDRILILEDTDGDGVHDKRKVFWTGANHLSGMTVGWGGVWICDSPNLLFIPDKNHDDVPDGEPEVILDGWTTGAKHNFVNGLTWGIDGWLYGRHGILRSSKVGKPGTPDDERIDLDCGIWRYHPASKKFEIVCRGTTNPWGLDWNDVGELFFTNNVNGHLWHGISGAYFPRMRNHGPGFGTHIYGHIQMCADHLHHAGSDSDWTKSRDGKGVHGKLGGGHSHCGGMIYLGGKWPEAYRNTIFMANTHGRRLNRDSLERHGSGYTGRHLKDFLTTDNQWFKGVSIKYGPDGDVFVSDWCDNGECHDSDGVHRTSGRIYKISYELGKDVLTSVDLWSASNLELAEYQAHPNEWFARKARLLLHHRHSTGDLTETKEVTESLTKLLSDSSQSISIRIRALLTLHVIERNDQSLLQDLLESENEYLRSWAIKLLCESKSPSSEVLAQLERMAKDETSSSVRLQLASSLQRISDSNRWPIAEALALRKEDAGDHNVPLMVWYGIKDVVQNDPERALAIADQTSFSDLPEFIARRLAEEGDLEAVFSSALKTKDDYRFSRMLAGVERALRGRSESSVPASWNKASQRAFEKGDPDLWNTAIRITSVFNKDEALKLARKTLTDTEADTGNREVAISTLAESKNIESIPDIVTALGEPKLSIAAIRALGRFSTPEAAAALISRMETYNSSQRSEAIVALTANKQHVTALIVALESGKVPRSAVTAFHARRVHAHKDGNLLKQFADAWGSFQAKEKDQMQKIRYWESQLRPDVLAKADVANGRAQYQALCSACHMLHGKGGKIGPDLTGSNRDSLYYLLENIIAPNASLPKDYRMTTITRKDDSLISGNIASQNEYTVTLRALTGEVTVSRKNIKTMETTDSSVMPAGILEPLSDEAVRDLIGFLQQP